MSSLVMLVAGTGISNFRFPQYLKKIHSRTAHDYCTVRATLAIAVVVPEVPVTVMM